MSSFVSIACSFLVGKNNKSELAKDGTSVVFYSQGFADLTGLADGVSL
jgi:hypothetical protein